MDGNWWFKFSLMALAMVLSIVYLVWSFGGWSTETELQGYYSRLAQLEAFVDNAQGDEARTAATRTLEDHRSREASGQWSFTISGDDAGLAAENLIAARVSDLTTPRIRAAFNTGKGAINGANGAADTKLKEGDVVEFAIEGGGHEDALVRPPAAAEYFPARKINLGLDLQGGIDLELQVDLRKALEAASDRGADQMVSILKEKEIEASSKRIPGTANVAVFIEESQRAAVRGAIKEGTGLYILQGTQEVDGRNAEVYSLEPLNEASIKETALQQAVETIRNRVDEFGVTEPVILTKGEDRITVQLPGLDDPQRAIDLVGQTAQLEFRMLYGDTHPDESWSDARVAEVVDKAVTEANLGDNYSDEALAAALAGRIPEDAEVFHNKKFDPLTMRHERSTPYLVNRKIDLTGDRVEYASVARDQFNSSYVRMELDNEGARIFSDLSGDNVGKRMAIILDGNVNSAPVFQEKIPNGIASITLGGSDSVEAVQDARDLVVVLHAGALPAPIEILHNRTVGKTLGDDSIAAGRMAATIAGLLILFFMAIYYRGAGLTANLAVLLNMLFILSILAAFGATLTLPGIAGIILTIGMAVDANVIIFERIREEIHAGRGVRAAIAAGYEKATWTILDANITTFITAAVLYSYGSGPIKGFAVTLMIGILTSVVTALVFTRLLFDYLCIKREVKSLSIGL
ncbi:MAG: protein translocase subunit SecD [Rickettsiales bacterium]|nr:protein translocase subunit SecD [Rickettsiales bacterium]